MWYLCVYTHTHTYDGILFRLFTKGNSIICDNTDEAAGHYTKCNKPDRTQIPHGIIYMWNL